MQCCCETVIQSTVVILLAKYMWAKALLSKHLEASANTSKELQLEKKISAEREIRESFTLVLTCNTENEGTALSVSNKKLAHIRDKAAKCHSRNSIYYSVYAQARTTRPLTYFNVPLINMTR